MKVLLVGLNYAPEPVGIGPYSAGLAQWLAARGHVVEAVVGEPYYPQWQRPEPALPLGVARMEDGVRVTRVRHYIPTRPTGARRIAHLASFAVSALPHAVRAAERIRPDVVFTVAPSLLSVPVALLAARAGGAKLWTHVQDLEFEAALATGLLRPGGMSARAARAVEKAILRLSDRVSTISPQMRARLAEKGIAPDRLADLRNWASDAFAPDAGEAARYREEWGLGGRKVALYSGNIANKQGIEIVIEAARLLAPRGDIAFVICGQGPNRARLEAEAAALDNVQVHDLQPAQRMGGLLAMAHMHLLPQIAGAADLVLPSKLTNMLQSGRPVVATALPGTGLFDEVAGCGVLTPPGDAAAFADAIRTLADDPSAAARMGQAAARRAAERWSRNAILAAFESDLERLVRG